MSTAQTSLAAAIKVVKNFASLPTSPFCSGTFPWDKDRSTLFYKLGGESRSLNFPATNPQLKSLFNACSAGKIDPGSFGVSFSPWHEGLVGFLEEGLLKSKKFRVDLPILKVYGPSGSPKADPKAPSSMIASLVIILPTVHKGGSFILSQKGTERTFDSSNAVTATGASPQAAFIASYSNKHRVNKVTSGYLVTLTYNFHRKRDKKTSLTLTPEEQEGEPELQEALDRLLNDPTFFPAGGFIGFGLKHKYPFVLEATKLPDIKEGLTGSDAAIKRACEDLSLDTSIKAVLLDEEDAPGRAVLTDNPTSYDYQVEGPIIDHVEAMLGGQGVLEYKKNGTMEPDSTGRQPIAWLTPSKKTNLFTFSYIDDDYKRPSAHDVNAEICLVAKIPPAEERDSLTAAPDTQAGSEPDHHQDKKRRLK